ncbi:hypothetical protein B0J18DRAFT_430419 [Chaetomium sp. MPI-SDFR-AT-0129]|nr:hypothetical protein B0J18DRAFT_430419 [Chaetomium sp. MPI-SDFR-AT-0129]
MYVPNRETDARFAICFPSSLLLQLLLLLQSTESSVLSALSALSALSLLYMHTLSIYCDYCKMKDEPAQLGIYLSFAPSFRVGPYLRTPVPS